MQADLFDFAYIPRWYDELHELAQLALPEPWKFKQPETETANLETPILERYLQQVFRKQAVEYMNAQDPSEAINAFYLREGIACLHTGLFTNQYKAIYMCFERNKRRDTVRE